MKINLINKLYFALAILLLIGIGVKIYKYAAWNRYYYKALLTVKETDSLKIETAFFITPDDLISIEKQNQASVMEMVQLNLLPKELVVKYASKEKRYKDTIPISIDRVKEIFNQIKKNGKQLELYSEKGPKKGYSFVIVQDDHAKLTIWIAGDKTRKSLLNYTLKSR